MKLPNICLAALLFNWARIQQRFLEKREVVLIKGTQKYFYTGRKIFLGQQIYGNYCYLYERLPRVGGDHGLELAGGEGVDVARLGGHQQHHLGARQRGKLVCLQQDHLKLEYLCQKGLGVSKMPRPNCIL